MRILSTRAVAFMLDTTVEEVKSLLRGGYLRSLQSTHVMEYMEQRVRDREVSLSLLAKAFTPDPDTPK